MDPANWNPEVFSGKRILTGSNITGNGMANAPQSGPKDRSKMAMYNHVSCQICVMAYVLSYRKFPSLRFNESKQFPEISLLVPGKST